MAAARNIGTLNVRQAYSDFVGSIDTRDYYQFSLVRNRTLYPWNITLDGLVPTRTWRCSTARGR